MTSLYKQSIPIFIKYLNNLSRILEKASIHAEEKLRRHDEMPAADMLNIIFQVQICCDTPIWFVDRVGCLEHTALEDNERTFEQLQARIERTVQYLTAVDPKVLDDRIDTPFIMEHKRMGKVEWSSGQAYLAEYAIPNFHFRLASAYCLCQAQGAPLAPLDYLNDVFVK